MWGMKSRVIIMTCGFGNNYFTRQIRLTGFCRLHNCDISCNTYLEFIISRSNYTILNINMKRIISAESNYFSFNAEFWLNDCWEKEWRVYLPLSLVKTLPHYSYYVRCRDVCGPWQISFFQPRELVILVIKFSIISFENGRAQVWLIEPVRLLISHF